MRRSRPLLIAAAALAAAVIAPLAAQYRMELDGGGSLRLVISCNVDGTYTCANERCGQFCCQMPG
jgi:hypothetical protein